jgi:DNA integrity scanning protein DisA with diadenylate cyclase activity
MLEAFIHIRFVDILDIFFVAFLLYQLYLLIKGTAAFNIIIGMFIFYLVWMVIKGLKMELMSDILGQVVGVGVLALIIIFQQEIRKMFLMLGTDITLIRNFLSLLSFSGETMSFQCSDKEIVVPAKLCRKLNRALIAFQTKSAKEYVIQVKDCLKFQGLAAKYFL